MNASMTPKNSLKLPLNAELVASANKLYTGLVEWQAIDRAFELLKERLPEFTVEATLSKVAAINAFYGTNLYAQSRMATHIARLAREVDLATIGPELVDKMAALILVDGAKTKRFVSFASKFAHFFISRERFPIYDSVAEQMLRGHFGRLSLPVATKYQAFIGYIDRLRKSVPSQFSYAELDRYLWITGTYLKWKDGQAVNAELARFFATHSEGDSEFATVRDQIEAQFEGVV